ncbi:MOSC domain-containing protein [Massilia sp. ZL223]|uniref:MOSC domain-containing protein n=1 Tax=Massilia sp. ZL223 TaxID=2824904 RepID=UPI001B82EF1B|nr:MOSC N-terminal beta barrel domain-containing protein [Massilia sp. ZL223]MBQ5961855.1 MOSC N-terminal beta barrel domain-containing protein [Massilia sp. ZL223]
MATLTELVVYPIKSCAGLSVPQATLAPSGLVAEGVHDREWMLVTREGQFLTQREYPRMALIAPRVDGDALVVEAPGMPLLRLPLAHDATAAILQVQIWDHSVPAADCGDAAAAWFADAIGGACRLVRFRSDVQRPTSTKWTGGTPSETRFADGYPLLLIGQASLDDLNAKLVAAGRAPLPMNRFRPNLVVEGIEAFEEDFVESFSTDGLSLRPVKPCARCPIPAIDQASGIPGPDPLDILQTYRANPRMEDAVCMGMNCIVQEGAGQVLRVGQHLDASIAF